MKNYSKARSLILRSILFMVIFGAGAHGCFAAALTADSKPALPPSDQGKLPSGAFTNPVVKTVSSLPNPLALRYERLPQGSRPAARLLDNDASAGTPPVR